MVYIIKYHAWEILLFSKYLMNIYIYKEYKKNEHGVTLFKYVT